MIVSECCVRHHPDTFLFPLPLEPFDVSLRSRITSYPIEPRVFSVAILYLAGLAPYWEKSPLHPTILIDGQEMTLRDFLHFPVNRPITISVVPTSIALSEGSPNRPDVGASKGHAGGVGVRILGVVAHAASQTVMYSAAFAGSSFKVKEDMRHSKFMGPLATYKEDEVLDPFVSGDTEAVESHSLLSSLEYLDFQRRLDGLSPIKSANFHDVSALKLMMSGVMLNTKSEEAPALLAGKTESLTPVTSHEHEGVQDFNGSLAPYS
nr:hypothetical protein [Tanacetum cinerariifolium]